MHFGQKARRMLFALVHDPDSPCYHSAGHACNLLCHDLFRLGLAGHNMWHQCTRYVTPEAS